MSMLEKAYRDWICLKSGKDGNGRVNKLKAFIQALFEVKNCYPSELLHECNTNEEKFILGETALGSIEKEN
jgi:hypothetical protein